VAITLSPGVDFAALLHALPRLRAVLVPLNTRLTAGERRAQLDAAAPRLIVDAPLEGDEAELEPPGELDPDAAHSILFTSGTTGAPKPVALTHGNHLASALASAWNLGVAPDDRWLCVLPLFHVGGLAILLRSAIYGTAAVVHPAFEADAALASLESGEATLVSLVPTQLRRLADAGLGAAPALRAALLGGGPLPRDLLAWAAERAFPALQTYGMTETASQIATLPAAEALARAGSAGRPLPGVKLRIAAEREEILVRGPMVARTAVGPDGWLHTGDRGRLDDDGFLWVEGRLDEVIVTGGEKVAAGEVEEALRSHPAVLDAAVLGEPDRDWGERVVAYVVLRAEATEGQLVAHCRERLAAHKAPKAVRRVAELPRTASGKTARRALGRAAGK
ncbi:MAG: AMP-binding protein, partial [Actinomycetota bacterium]|nr:AMP-binding protein [Actinomycetota bacterium]